MWCGMFFLGDRGCFSKGRGIGAPLGGLTRIMTSFYLEAIPSVEWMVLTPNKEVCVKRTLKSG